MKMKTVEIPEELHQKLKMEAVRTKTNLKALVEEALREKLAKLKKQG
jgi:predicted HicB family RNase H-like nuclease